jgi:universal stress protein F
VNEDCVKLTTYFGEHDGTADGRLALDRAWPLRRSPVPNEPAVVRLDGFGVCISVMRTRFSGDPPVVSVAVERRERVEPMLNPVQQIKPSGSVTVERARLPSGEVGRERLPSNSEAPQRTPSTRPGNLSDVPWGRDRIRPDAPTSPSVPRRRAQFFGRKLRRPDELTVLGIQGQLPTYAASLGEVDEVKCEKDEFFARVLSQAQQTATDRGVSARTDLVPGHSADAIIHCAAAHAHDLIVIAHHAHIFGDMHIGSTADRVAHHAPCPVMVVR